MTPVGSGSGGAGHSNAHETAISDTITNLRSVPHLLLEEYTLNPTTFLPSFLEMNLVDATNVSGRRTLRQIMEGMRVKCDEVVRAVGGGSGGGSAAGDGSIPAVSSASALRVRLATYLSHLLTHYQSELVLAILYGVERYSLQRASATAAESVYGMKRSRVVMERGDNNGGGGGGIRLAPLNKGGRIRCTILAALLPYLREKLATFYRNQQLSDNNANNNPTRLERIRHKLNTIFRTVYPYLAMSTEGASLAYQFLYLAGMTGYYSPSMHVLGVLTRRITRADLQQQQQQQQHDGLNRAATGARNAAEQTNDGTNGDVAAIVDSSARGMMESNAKAAPPAASGIGTAVTTTLQSGRADHIIRAIRTAILVGGSTLLVTGWIAHFREELRQRRRRWISGEDGTASGENGNSQHPRQRRQRAHGDRNAAATNRSIWTPQSNPIPPPHPPKLLDESESEHLRRGLPSDNSSCPICHRPRVNPAASTSGYVFCYRCLVMHLRSNEERCPLTGMHCPESRVIRLFEPTAGGTNASGTSSDGRNGGNEMRVDHSQGAGQSTGF